MNYINQVIRHIVLNISVSLKPTCMLITPSFSFAWLVYSLIDQLDLSLVRYNVPCSLPGTPAFEPFNWGNMDEKLATPGLNSHFIHGEI